ncbi:uncharacterized protein Aud_009143 [Aspergillus udagawae]|uniref:Uncharacterized protein n=1 Tax=Aspergillus udagawae TaxID=91492 RepID=A0A8E0QWB5_9EURO|nr:uncharacterized protein Aud_009143 [Aspergillus udagawae]GIC92672.1 hypothetical protein Aud_009143 [Aspergillus udagawae]
MSMQNQPIFSGKPVEDVDLYIDQCRFMRAGMQMTPEEKKQAIATTLFVGLRDGALRFGRTLPKTHYDDALDPIDLDFFIRFQLRGRIRRQGDITKRRVQMAHEYALYQYRQGKITDVAQGGQYTRVYLCDSPWAQNTQAPKQWHGAPLPTIRKAIGALGSPRIGRIPQDMVMKLTILRDLYYLDDDETERRHQLERPSKEDNYQDSDEEEDDNRYEEEEEEEEEGDEDEDEDDETEAESKGVFKTS